MVRFVIVAGALVLALGTGARTTSAPGDREDADLHRLYGSGRFTPIWSDADGRPLPRAHAALALLQDAAAEGLDMADYDAAQVEEISAGLEAAPSPSIDTVARFDRLLSRSLLRYFQHLHLGRVDPRTIGFKMSLAADEHDFVQVLRETVAQNDIRAAATKLAPPLVQYRLLRGALASYRWFAADASLAPPPASPTVVHPGDPYPALPRLHRLLVLLGDLPTDAPLDAGGYEGPIVQGVERFQARHGLEPDGVLGRATQAALQVPLTARVRQIELALERLRWLPDLGDRRFIALNVPMFQLWGWDSIPPTGEPSFAMKAIVGRAAVTQTPIFVDEMDHVIFRPYWNVPASILRGEILPAFARNPAHPDRQDFEIVRGPGDDTRPLEPMVQNLALLDRGVLRLRQRPGPNNALGLVKFVFPNDYDVYLHGTPAQELFSRARRDFSHGCVRVEDPPALAEWVLKGEPGWTRERVLDAISGPATRRVAISDPIQVILFYMTAAVIPAESTVHFADDIYGHDRALDRALTRRR